MCGRCEEVLKNSLTSKTGHYFAKALSELKDRLQRTETKQEGKVNPKLLTAQVNLKVYAFCALQNMKEVLVTLVVVLRPLVVGEDG